jgi:RHS repeat-associated protein
LTRVTDYYASGDGEGHVQFEKVKQGSGGTAVKLKAFEYVARTAGLASVHPVSKETVYRNSDGTGGIDTTYSYSWYTGTVQMEERVTSLPAIPTAQHGSGSADTRTERFDLYGNLIWLKSERGFLSRHTYDIPTGVRTETIEDVDTTHVSDEPSGWTTPSGGGLHLISEFDADARGRVIETREPWHTIDLGGTPTSVRSVQWSVYKDLDGEVWSAAGYATGTAPNYTYTLINPVSITRRDDAGRVTDEIQAVRASTSGKLSASDSFPQSTWVRWSTNSYSDQGDPVWSRVYHTIPASGAGSSGTNYDQTDFGIDAQGRRNKVKSPGGTITRTVFDVRGQAIKTYVGTNDTGATDSDPTGGGASGNNMVLVSENEFDGGSAGGDGNLTKVTQHVDSGTTRVTSMSYDFRGRRIDTDGEIDHFERQTYDNFDRVVKSERYNTSASGNLISRSETKFDDRGRTYQSIRYAVNPSTGSVGDALIDRSWFGANGSPIKQLPGGTQQFTKTAYDSLGRPVKTYVGFDTSESTYADATTVTGDTIFEQIETSYDAAGNAILVTQRSRLHDATGTGELSTPSGSQPRARVTYTALYPDAAGREIARANYGDNGGAWFTHSSTIPSRSDTVLVQSIEYNSEGESYKSIDPAGKEDRTFYDDAGRVVKTVENYDDGDPTTGAADKDRIVEFTYTADGQRKTITARQQNSANDQVTRYVYGTTLSDSDIARSDLLRAVIYPDSDDADSPLGNGSDGVYDRVEHRYNRQGEIKETKDQNGTVHTFEFDSLARPIHDRITTLGSGVDGAVRRVSTTYEVRGLVEKITTYDNAAIGSGSAVNEVVREYNDLGLIVKEYQEHSGAKSGSTPYVGYNYDTSASGGEFTKGMRPTSLRYPNGRLVHFTYGSTGSAGDNLNQLQAIKDDSSGSPGATLASYTYLGLRTVVVQDLEEPDITLDLFGGTSGTYAGLDRFGRVIDQRWYDYGSSADVDRFKYGYDRASNRIWRENTVSKALSPPVYLDEFYTYDGLHRLKSFDRGQLNGTYTGITGTPAREEDWSLDPLGNWSNFIQKTSGTTDLNQSRLVNVVNEITDFTETVGPSWITPAYDRAGNMTTIPKPADPTTGFTGTYDAWNHLVKIESGSSTVATYAYNGLHRRVAMTADSTTRHFYYTSSWQAIEERLGTSTNADRQFVWGPLYIDHLVLRDRDTSDPPNATLDERLYAMQDANWNVTALADTNGDGTERYRYEPFGPRLVLDPLFVSRTGSLFGWAHGFVGRPMNPYSQLNCLRYRQLHTVLGRFLQRDPLEYGDNDLTMVSYARNNPATYVDPLGLKVHVFAFEGTLGTGLLGTRILSINNVLATEFKPIVDQYSPLAEWHYFSQDHFDPVGFEAHALNIEITAKRRERDFPCCYPRIVILGYSWGGNTAADMVKRLARGLVRKPVVVDAVFTIDPVFGRYWASTTAFDASNLGNYCRWDNYYQTVDTNSLLVGLLAGIPPKHRTNIYGDQIRGADNHLMNGEFSDVPGSRTIRDPRIAHVGLPRLPVVKNAFRNMLRDYFTTLGIRRMDCCSPGTCPVPLCLGDEPGQA